MPERDRRTPPAQARAETATLDAAPLRVALWRPGAAPEWRGGASGDPLLAEANALFQDPAAAEARRIWAEDPDRGAEFLRLHALSEDRRIAEWSTAAVDGDAGSPVFFTAFLPAPDQAARLTGLMANRRARRRLRQRLAAEIDAGRPSASLAFSVDNLREINQAYGDDVADAVLAEVCVRLRDVAKRALSETTTLSHLSGSKFALIARGLDETQARLLARAAQDSIAATPIDTRHGRVAATVSAGVAAYDARAGARRTDAQAQAAEIMARALDALTAARRDGPSGLAAARPEESAQLHLAERQRQARDAVAALEDGRLRIAFQPIVSSGSRRPAFHECLARLAAPDGVITPAGAFVPLIERLGQVRLLDRRMLARVFDALEDAPRARLALNVSRQTLRDREWLAQFERRAAQAPRAAERLIIEITESSASGDPSAAAAFMAAVRARGAAVALDDFGAGYTALRHLRDFRFDFLKIDGTFAAGVDSDPDNRLFVKAMVDIARHYEMSAIAEFVETEAQAAALAALGVTYQQGYLHGAPSMRLAAAEAPAVRNGALSA